MYQVLANPKNYVPVAKALYKAWNPTGKRQGQWWIPRPLPSRTVRRLPVVGYSRRPELKFCAFPAASSHDTRVFTASWWLSTLVNVGDGTGVDERIGRRIAVKSLNVKWYVTPPASQTEHIFARIIIVAVMTAGTTSSDIMEYTAYSSRKKINSASRFRTLYDETRTFDPNSENMWNGKFFKRFKKPFMITYTGDLDTNWNQNIVILYADSGSTEHVTQHLSSVVRYSDV